MAKDPAFLFYYQDFLVGTDFLTPEEVGSYIRILCHMAHKGRLKKEHMQSICRGYALTIPLLEKFEIDNEGYYFNPRLALEVKKRQFYTESRRNNAKGYAKDMPKHMEDENKDENKDIIKDKNKKPTTEEIRAYCLERKNTIDPESFFNFYEANGWVQGNSKKPIKNWKACIITWEKRDGNKSGNKIDNRSEPERLRRKDALDKLGD